jgi:hypothetical protein
MIDKMIKKKDHITLDQLGRDFPFKAPDGYFEQLTARVMSTVESDNKTPKEFTLFRFIKPAIAVAASLLIIIGLVYYSAKVISTGSLKSSQIASMIDDEEFVISYPLNDRAIFETLENTLPDETFDKDQLETVLLASVSDYELIDLTNSK